jgi:hypothetical protein
MDKNDALLRELIGLELSEVTFVRSYYQFRFDGPRLTLINDLTIAVNNRDIKLDEPAFYMALVKCVGSRVVDIVFKDKEYFGMGFENGYQIHMSLKPEDYVTSDALMFDLNDQDHRWISI